MENRSFTSAETDAKSFPELNVLENVAVDCWDRMRISTQTLTSLPISFSLNRSMNFFNFNYLDHQITPNETQVFWLLASLGVSASDTSQEFIQVEDVLISSTFFEFTFMLTSHSADTRQFTLEIIVFLDSG